MNAFVNQVKSNKTRTTNGMKAKTSTSDNVVDLFYKIGASRGQDIVPQFVAALAEDENLAVRVALWSRDIRDGAGERGLFRKILSYLENNRPELAKRILPKVPELGRWDDLFVFKTPELKNEAFTLIAEALNNKNGLAAKWTPRKGELAVEFRKFLGWTPKFYRKRLVELTNVVESKMCAKDWDTINFSHVPSVASARYKKAFYRNTPKYAEYVASLVKGDNPKVKVNAGAVYPYDVIKGVFNNRYNSVENNLIIKQWEALPNYMNDSKVLPLVDVSGSMTCTVGGNPNLSCIDVAVSLGLYCAEKNKGVFKDTFLTFSANPKLLHLKGNILEKMHQMVKSDWNMNTNLHAAIDLILLTAKKGKVSQDEMPEILLILSDMQFDGCIQFDDSAYKMMKRKFEDAGYQLPQIVFWNLNARDNVPVKADKSGVALVSGFSPAILSSILGGDTEQFTPRGIMMKKIMDSRYDF